MGALVTGAVLVGCAAPTSEPTPQVIKETQEVEVEVEVTRIVEKEGETVVEEVIVTATPAAVEPVTITWLNMWGGAREPLMLEMIARFQEENPYITVENQVQPWDNRAERIATAIASSDPPSLVMVLRYEMQKFAYEDLIIPIDSYADGEDFDVREMIYPAELLNCQWGDHLYSYPLPTGGGATCFWLYDKKLLGDAGFDPESPPETWDEVEQAVSAISRVEGGNLEVAGIGQFQGFFENWIYCNNGQYYSDDLKQLTFNQPEAVETLEWMVKLMNEYLGGYDAYRGFWEAFGAGGREAVDWPFYTGRLALWPTAVPSFFYMETAAPDRYLDTEQWGVMNVPYNGNNPEAKAVGTTATDGGWNQVIPKGLDKNVQDAAYEWMKFFTIRRAGGCWFLLEQNRPSPVRECNENPEYYEANPYWDKVLQALELDIPFPMTPVQGEIREAVSASLDEVWLGTKAPKEALDEAYDQAQPVLDEFWADS
jgi:ABC-type glycerol-3-phosphate transport system substrate-binding protein